MTRASSHLVQHLAGLVGSSVEIILEIHASFPDVAPDESVRIVTEDARTLKFPERGFEGQWPRGMRAFRFPSRPAQGQQSQAHLAGLR
jgi:hypothetical protein